jgi:hypothetical protein
MLLLGLTATGSLADPSIVADLDSNAMNGPDTLQADVGDTILVRVWITDSADSLVGFGITLGDTSGTLAWAEGDTDAVYTTPAGWANIPVHVDENDRLLLQGQDFSFSEPLHIPCQVAQLKFVAVSPESCAVFTWDTAISGWQNWEFTEGRSRASRERSSASPGKKTEGVTKVGVRTISPAAVSRRATTREEETSVASTAGSISATRASTSPRSPRPGPSGGSWTTLELSRLTATATRSNLASILEGPVTWFV